MASPPPFLKASEFIDLFFFRSSIERIRDAHTWLNGAIVQVRETEVFTRAIKKGARRTPVDETLTWVLSETSDATHREVIARATYVYAWAVFADLLADCVEAVYTRHPTRLNRGMNAQRDRTVVCRLLEDEASKSTIVADLVRDAVASFRKGDYPEMPEHFTKRLDIEWKPAWSSALARAHQRRNDAAHSTNFAVPPLEEVRVDLDAIIETGSEVARACGTKHDVHLRQDAADPRIESLFNPEVFAAVLRRVDPPKT